MDIPAVDGVRYFYTLDGSNPYTNCAQPAGQLSITLAKDQVLTVCSRQNKACATVIL